MLPRPAVHVARVCLYSRSREPLAVLGPLAAAGARLGVNVALPAAHTRTDEFIASVRFYACCKLGAVRSCLLGWFSNGAVSLRSLYVQTPVLEASD